MKKNFPKVLIIGAESFNQTSGTGVTLTNLFQEWPKDKISVAANSNDMVYCEKERPCFLYYNFLSHTESIVMSNINKTKFRYIIKCIINGLGVGDYFSHYKVNTKFLTFFDEFNPDVVYTLLGNVSLMRFILSLKKKRNFRLVVHIMDDWLIGSYGYRFFPFIWKKIANRYFINILNDKNIICMSICKEMSDEYKQRYDKYFIPFHNPIDPSKWENNSKMDYEKNITISYLGKINKNTQSNLIDLCETVEKLNDGEINIMFYIYTSDFCNRNFHLLDMYKHSKVCPSVPQREVPNIMQNSTFLFLPLGFDKKSIEYARLSMPTKLTEYLISKRPIILYCPEELALYKYIMRHSAAIFCKKGVDNIYSSLVYALDHKEKTEKIVNNAYRLAISYHTCDYVREEFRKSFLQ